MFEAKKSKISVWVLGRRRLLVIGGIILCLSNWSCDSTDKYIGLLSSPEPDIRKSAAFKLLLRGEHAVPALLTELETAPDSTRFIIIQLLGKIGDERAVQPLVEILSGEKRDALREVAAESLGKMGTSTAIPPLIETLQRDESPTVRVESIKGLVNLRLEDSAPLIEALEDWFPQVRKEALIGLVRLQHEGWGEHLYALVKDPDPGVRYIAVQLLGRQGGNKGIGLLIEALEDESGGVREEAASALGRLGAVEAREELIDLMTRSSNPDGEAARRALKEITGVDYQVTD